MVIWASWGDGFGAEVVLEFESPHDVTQLAVKTMSMYRKTHRETCKFMGAHENQMLCMYGKRMSEYLPVTR